MRALVRIYYLVAYYWSWVLFALGGLTLNFFCAFLCLFPHSPNLRIRVRSVIAWLFAFWLKWFHASGVVRISWINFDARPLSCGTVYVANHPTLVDAPVLLSRLPNAICIFKPALLRNPVVAPAAILAGYVAGDKGVDVIREAAEKVAGGCSLLIFPEGTRTQAGQLINPLKSGFALIAQRAHAPIRLISIRATPWLVSKDAAWWKFPPLPGRFEITLGPELRPETAGSATEMTALVQAQLASLASPLPISHDLCHPRTSC
jgi:1-acyl-sn-glycerol-3-phosphate acyltransferase